MVGYVTVSVLCHTQMAIKLETFHSDILSAQLAALFWLTVHWQKGWGRNSEARYSEDHISEALYSENCYSKARYSEKLQNQ